MNFLPTAFLTLVASVSASKNSKELSTTDLHM